MSQHSWILEQYITDHVLPHEHIMSWIKWDPTITVEKIILKSEADVTLGVFLNVDEKGLNPDEITQGMLTIDKKFIQIPGFIGFVAKYDALPEKSRTINFIVEFIMVDSTIPVTLTTDVLRPELYLEDEQKSILVTANNPSTIQPLSLKLNNSSKAFAKNLELFSDIELTPNVNVKVQNVVTEVKDEQLLFVETNKILSSNILVSGQGYCMISVGYDYEDKMGNKYKTNLINVGINLQQKSSIKIPVTNDVAGNREELTLISNKELLVPIISR